MIFCSFTLKLPLHFPWLLVSCLPKVHPDSDYYIKLSVWGLWAWFMVWQTEVFVLLKQTPKVGICFRKTKKWPATPWEFSVRVWRSLFVLLVPHRDQEVFLAVMDRKKNITPSDLNRAGLVLSYWRLLLCWRTFYVDCAKGDSVYRKRKARPSGEGGPGTLSHLQWSTLSPKPGSMIVAFPMLMNPTNNVFFHFCLWFTWTRRSSISFRTKVKMLMFVGPFEKQC